MKKHLKRLLSLMMAVLLCIGVMPSSAFAASYDYDGYISMIDHNTRGYSLSSNLPAPFGGYSSNKFTELRINDLKAFRTAYCIQFSVGVHTGIGYDQSDDYAAFTAEQKSMINTALTLGYNVETGTKYGGSAIDEYIATQILIWLIAHEQLGTGYETQIVNEFTVNSPAAKPIFYQLRENVVNYHTIPSFATDDPSAVGAYTHALKYNESNGKNETTLVDENNVLGNFAVSYPGVDFSVSGNELHVSTSETEFGTITAEKRLPSSVPGVVTGGTKYWLRDEYQNVVTFDVEGSAEPVKCCFSLEIKAGALQLVKTSEDGKVEGIPFHISGNGVEKDVVTGPDGTIKVDNLQAGNYTVTEKAPDKYVQPASQQVTIYPGQTSSVSFSNILKKFTVEMEKKDSGHNKPRSPEYEAQGDATLDGAVYGLFKGETLLDTYPSITDALQWAGWIWRGCVVWDKMTSRPQKGRFRQQSEYVVWGSNGPMPVNRPVGCLPGVFRYANPQNRTHVTEKPLQLMRDLVKICVPGGRIFDPFCGAGTTVLAAKLEGYEAVGVEVTDAYYKLGSDRVRFALEAHTEAEETAESSCGCPRG